MTKGFVNDTMKQRQVKNMQRIERLAGWIRDSKSTVVLTGAGMSTESGLPDFRSESGWWKNYDPTTLATVDAMKSNYPLFHEFYSVRFKALEECKPHKGHLILADWERKGLVFSIATQNVDGFHNAAGNERVHELHGSLRDVRCSGCDRPDTIEAFLGGRGCKHCDNKLRPGVVLFGEMLPQDAWNSAIGDINEAELVLVIGTSLKVYPVNQLPSMTEGRTAYINYAMERESGGFDIAIQGKAGEVLERLDGVITGI